ncbi:MAG: superoxide dismutase, Ni [Candidatus Aenigmarchaeota archaeon]|nr:superoxide dismutase, Ni [Candidatus Aenigmarchaeota archaeon]
MPLLYTLFELLDKIFPAKIAYAHCDIPCGIYDPHLAQMAAHTVIRMVTLINELTPKMTPDAKPEQMHEHVQKNPDLHDLVWKVMKLGSKVKQEVNLQSSEDLLETVNKIAEIFWKTKDMGTVRYKSPYPTARETVYPAPKKS